MPFHELHNRNRSKARGRHALRLAGFMLLATAACIPPRPAHAQDDETRARLDQMQNDIDTLNRAVYKGQPPANAPVALGDASTAATASLDVRLSQVETEIASLTGEVQELQHQVQVLQQQDQDTFGKLDARVAVLEHAGAATPAATLAAAGATAQGGLTGADTGAAPPGADATPADVETPSDADFTGGTASGSAAPHAATPVFTSGGASSSATGAMPAPDSGTPPAPIASTPDKAYEDAFTLLKAKKYAEAQQAFAGFLAKYPKHPLAANAQFWLGETYYDRSQFDKAAKAFAVSYQNYPQGPKGPDSLLKLGMSLNGLGKHNEACLTYAQLKKQFPDSGPPLARAGQEADKIGCKS
jgi:tol-pal system protein YbgF